MSAGVPAMFSNVGTALDAVATALGDAGLPEARLSAEWLVAEVAGCPRLEIPLWAARELPAAERARLSGMSRRLLNGEPLQYVLGHADFMGLRIRTDRRALIPRPETEGLVERALDIMRELEDMPVRVADVGTGTGCIALALAARGPDTRIQALDISRQALELAAENVAAHALGGRIQLREADLLDGLAPDSLDLVVSNPPYVTRHEWEGLPRHIRLHEPSLALEAGADGLDVLRRLAPQAHRALRPGGRVLIEIGAGQGAAVIDLLNRAGFRGVVLGEDLTGHDRYVEGAA